MQASSRELQHGDEHRVLSPSSKSTANVERLCEPIAQPSGGALVRAAPVPGRQAEQPSRASAPPATGVPSRPLSSADLRVVQLPPTEKQYDWFCNQIGKRSKFTKDGLLTAILGMTLERIGTGYRLGPRLPPCRVAVVRQAKIVTVSAWEVLTIMIQYM